VFGIVTDMEKWYFMICTLNKKGKPSFGLSKPISVPYNNNGDMQINVEKVLGHIVWLLKEAQKPVEVSPNGEQQRVLKKQKSSYSQTTIASLRELNTKLIVEISKLRKKYAELETKNIEVNVENAKVK
ncbi:3902_t:CDS:2, partial [Gigaspora rosea]